MGTLANRAKLRLSCSFCDECMPGSSALTTTSPALTPVSESVMNGSAATFSPTCFMVTIVRTPASDAPTAVSMADLLVDAPLGDDAVEPGGGLHDLRGRRARVAAGEAGAGAHGAVRDGLVT